MKTAVSIDQLIERDHATSFADLALDFFEAPELYTLVFKQGRVLGPAELRKIHASFLSHKIDRVGPLKARTFMAPSASNNLTVPCSTELLFSISRGLGHGLNLCQDVKQVVYLYDLKFLDRPTGVLQKFFNSYVRKWSLKKLDQAYEIWVSSNALKNIIEKETSREVKVVEPFFNTHEFPLVPSHVYPHEFYLINSQGLDTHLAKRLLKELPKRGLPFKFIGEDSHLDALKTGEKRDLFGGDRCAGELAPLLAASRGLLDLSGCDSHFDFPLMALQTLSCGRPVVGLESDLKREFLSDKGVFWITDTISFNQLSVDEKLDLISKSLDNLDSSFENIDSESLHKQVNRFHPAGFYGHLKRLKSGLTKSG